MEREYNPKPLAGETKQDLENLPIVSTQSPVALIQPYEKPKFERQTTMNFPEKIWEKVNGGFLMERGYESRPVKPKFRDPSTLSPEQLTDPDYRLKQLQKLNDESRGNKFKITCSRCHHCR